MSNLHHILYDPLSLWEQMKITLSLTPVVLAGFLVVAAIATGRKKR